MEDQRSLDQRLGKNKAQALFGVHQLPSDNQIRHVLDATEPGQVKLLFSSLCQALHQAGVVETYRSVNQTLQLAFEGVPYFSSSAMHCPQCLVRQHANGAVTYSHPALTSVLVKPGLDKVIPLAPEFVRPQDGAEQQDGELNAAKRWLAAWGNAYRPLGVIQAKEHIPHLAMLYPDFKGNCLDWKPPASTALPDVAPALSQTYLLFAPVS